ncbi:ABC transporter permease [Mesorhizobium tianshanense]|uniref:Ribose transport system permease protein n=1 Tax=Mesorhizobium tianshanense TaxID=39844 RepID=A0A562P2Q5_9HYPH|nr:ABC transporter permease [Mesorhizobium tianshanense]TWI38758.1 ribose transport system permease protein [Mesorhizobium tianshanense]GLS36692.1 ABC transporter permease [Mesorhizobium tianshanense]
MSLSDATRQTEPRAGSLRLVELFVDNIVWAILAITLLAFCLFIPGYGQTGIFLNIVEQSAFVGILSVGLSIAIISGQIDLSIESTMALAAMATAVLVSSSAAGFGWTPQPLWLVVPGSLLVALCVGLAVGSFNAFLVIRLKLNAFIATLGSYILFRGAVVALSGGKTVFGLPSPLRAVALSKVLGVPLLAWVTVAVFLAFTFILTKTPFGRYVYLVGGNPVAPFRAGIRVRSVSAAAFLLSAVLAAFAGWLLATRTSGATPNLGIGMLFEAFAAVVIGGVSLKGGEGKLSGVVAGVLLLSSIRTAVNLLMLQPHYTQMIQGGLVIAAMLLDSAKHSIRSRYL